MTEHTKGRLHVRSKKRTIEIISEGSIPYATPIAHIGSSSPEDQANARRLVAAWNACEAFTTEALEAGCVAQWVNELCGTDEEKEETPCKPT